MASRIAAHLASRSYGLDVRTGDWISSEILDEILGSVGEYPHTREGWLALVHSEDREGATDYLEKEVIGLGRDCQMEYRIVRPSDEKTRWVLCAGQLSFDVRRSPIKLTGTVLDITERKSIEAATLAGAENGEHRPPGRRRRSRLQQFAHGNQRLCRSGAAAHLRQRPCVLADRGNPHRRRPRCRTDDATAGIQPETGTPAEGGQPQ